MPLTKQISSTVHFGCVKPTNSVDVSEEEGEVFVHIPKAESLSHGNDP